MTVIIHRLFQKDLTAALRYYDEEGGSKFSQTTELSSRRVVLILACFQVGLITFITSGFGWQTAGPFVRHSYISQSDACRLFWLRISSFLGYLGAWVIRHFKLLGNTFLVIRTAGNFKPPFNSMSYRSTTA